MLVEYTKNIEEALKRVADNKYVAFDTCTGIYTKPSDSEELGDNVAIITHTGLIIYTYSKTINL